jgi:hypothetical protein
LLSAQVVLTDRMEQLAKAQAHTDERSRQTKEEKEEMDERIGVLIRMMDEWIKRHP